MPDIDEPIRKPGLEHGSLRDGGIETVLQPESPRGPKNEPGTRADGSNSAQGTLDVSHHSHGFLVTVVREEREPWTRSQWSRRFVRDQLFHE